MTTATAAAYLSVDMEGVATLVHWDEVRPSADAAYERACRLMSDETNAVIEGICADAAARVTVNDSHSFMRNLRPERLPSDVTLVTGGNKPQYMLEGIGPEFDAVFFVGYHGAIGQRNAVMSHSYSPRVIYECRLNGAPVGEIAINAALAGHYGVPVVFVSGDRTTVEEARAVVPWAITVETKQSVSAYAAASLSPIRACDGLRAGARQAMHARAQARPYTLPPPIALAVDTCNTAQADLIELIPGCTRTGARSVSYEADEFPQIYRALVAMIRIGSNAPA